MEASLPVVECFHSLQGEGEHAGRSAYFIRLASCKVGCPWCDTKNSWNSELHPQQSLIDLSSNTAKAQKEGAAFGNIEARNAKTTCRRCRNPGSQESRNLPQRNRNFCD